MDEDLELQKQYESLMVNGEKYYELVLNYNNNSKLSYLSIGGWITFRSQDNIHFNRKLIIIFNKMYFIRTNYINTSEGRYTKRNNIFKTINELFKYIKNNDIKICDDDEIRTK